MLEKTTKLTVDFVDVFIDIFGCLFVSLSGDIKKSIYASLMGQYEGLIVTILRKPTLTAYVLWFRRSSGDFINVTSSLMTASITFRIG